MKSRRAFSLVELIIVLSVGTAMLMLAMSVLYMLKQTQVDMRQRLTDARTITRLADRFREDVHAASRMERVSGEASTPDTVVWQFTCEPDSVVRYELTQHRVHRSQTAGKTIHDDYRLPAESRVVIRPPEPASSLVELRLEAADATTADFRPIQIEAVLGLANRHSARNEGTTK